MLFSVVAVAATGLAVSSGVVLKNDTASGDAASAGRVAADPAAAALSAAKTATKNGSRVQAQSRLVSMLRARSGEVASRSDRRTAVDATKATHLDQGSGGQATRTEDLASQDPRTIARALLPKYGFSSSEFSCLDALYMSESGWDVHADNPTSDAYGIPQALPGGKMASVGSDWANNPVTQIRWGLQYIRSSYGNPCSAWSFKQGHGWY